MPGQTQPALRLLYEFFDQWLNSFLAHNQEIFPDLSMEVRMDADQVYDENGETYWYGHEATYSCQNASYTALMYGVPIGHINQGERLTAEEAWTKSQQMLDQVLQSTDGKLLYIEQFLYMDNTPGFEHNAQVLDDQVDDYIVAMADVLRDESWATESGPTRIMETICCTILSSPWETAAGSWRRRCGDRV